jgi:Holliday junction resolvase RusA-like endonuclease
MITAEEIEILGIPLPWKAPYVSSRGAYSPRTNMMEDTRFVLRNKYKGPFFTEAINVDFIFNMPIPKSTSKKKRLLMLCGNIRPIGTPDRGNLEKLYADILQGICYKNDSIVVGGAVEKWYSEIPSTKIRIYPACPS